MKQNHNCDTLWSHEIHRHLQVKVTTPQVPFRAYLENETGEGKQVGTLSVGTVS